MHLEYFVSVVPGYFIAKKFYALIIIRCDISLCIYIIEDHVVPISKGTRCIGRAKFARILNLSPSAHPAQHRDKQEQEKRSNFLHFCLVFYYYLLVVCSDWNAQKHRERLPRYMTVGGKSWCVRKCAVWIWMSVVVFDKGARTGYGALKDEGGHVVHLRSALYGQVDINSKYSRQR